MFPVPNFRFNVKNVDVRVISALLCTVDSVRFLVYGESFVYVYVIQLFRCTW